MDKGTAATISIATLFLATGCGGSEGPASREPAGSSRTAPASTSPSSTLGPITIRGFVHASDGTLLPLATVCSQLVASSDTTDCAISGVDGSFALPAPAAQPLVVTFRREGFLPTLRAIATDASDITLPPGEDMLFPAVSPQTFLGAPVDPSAGHIQFRVVSPGSQPAPNVSVTLLPYGLLPSPDVRSPTIYLDAQGAPQTGQTAGTSGWFANVPEGMYLVRFGHDSVSCTANALYGYPVTGFQGQDPSSVQAEVVVPVMAGMVTAPVSVTCTQ
jgi:hypothetical protein